MLEVDTTFNTNNLRLPLTVLTGITNTGNSFPVAFCFVPSESKASFDFVFEKLKELVWDEYPPPKVIVGDQAKDFLLHSHIVCRVLWVSSANGMLLRISESCLLDSGYEEGEG
jgi:MULE transposase domain.